MPGTIVVPEEDLAAYLRALFAGFWNTGFRKMILLNGQGQDYVLPLAIHQFAKKYQVPSIIVAVNWWFVIPEHIRDKAHGGPFETPFIHGDEVETSFSMALFPELIDQRYAEKTKPMQIFPAGHINKSGSAYSNELPIDFWLQVGASAIEVVSTPEGVVGDVGRPGLCREAHQRYPEHVSGWQTPPIEATTMRPREQIEAVIKGPLQEGSTHIYTLAYPT